MTTPFDGPGPEPFYRYHVFCCTNQRVEGHPRGDCTTRGGLRLRTYMKAKAELLGLAGVRVNASGCLDRCENGPVLVVYPEGVWYRAESQQDIDEILETHIRNGQPVERLMLNNED